MSDDELPELVPEMDYTLMGLEELLQADELHGLRQILSMDVTCLSRNTENDDEVQSRRRVTFGVMDFDAIPGDFGSSEAPWPFISLSDPTECIAHMVGANDVVLKESSIKIVVEFPLRTPQLFEIESIGGFTRAKLAKEISSIYQNIYNEEDRTSPQIAHYTHGFARSRTSGKYGIYGYWLQSLDLSEMWQSAHALPGSYWYLDIVR